jgi:hypothetical protein
VSSSIKKLAVAVGATAIVVSTPVAGAWAADGVSGDTSGKGLGTQAVAEGEQHPPRHEQDDEEQRTVARSVGSGIVDGKEWSVTLRFCSEVPQDFPSTDGTSGFAVPGYTARPTKARPGLGSSSATPLRARPLPV